MLIIDGVEYDLWTPKDEVKEFHPMVKAHYREIFDEDALYFDAKHVLKTPSKIGSIPDAYVISFKRGEWCVVENELSSHPVFDHIVNQLNRFLNGLKTPEARNQILEAIYEDIDNDLLLRATVQRQIDFRDIHHALSKLMTKQPRIIVIIDRKTLEVEEALQNLNPTPSIVEFKTYVRKDAPNIRAHLFEPLYTSERPSGKKTSRNETRRPVPEHYKIWEKKLEWVDQNVSDIVKTLTSQIIQLGNVVHRASGPDYVFFKDQPGTKTIFAGLFLTKQALKVRIRTDPTTFRDPGKWTRDKTYRWFFKVGEKEFKVTSKDQIDYAMELIKQSFQLAGAHLPTYTFMGAEQLQITNVEFSDSGTKSIKLTINNTGTSAATITEIRVNNIKQTATSPTLPQAIVANSRSALTAIYTWVPGNNYQVKLISSRGNQLSYSAVAPAT